MTKKESDIKLKTRKYDAEDIVVLEGLEPVRKRPGMYIGSTGPDGLHHLFVEIFDNARDEAMAGQCNEIEVVLLPDDLVRVADNGAGIPVAVHKQTKVSALETVMTKLHAGGKFGGSGYKIAGGLHGVGASVVNALSQWLRAEVYRDGGKFVQEYRRGQKVSAVRKVGSSNIHGTVITFKPDPQIFPATAFDWDRIVHHLRGQAYLIKGLHLRLIDARKSSDLPDPGNVHYLRELNLNFPSRSFYFEGGLLSLIKYQTRNEKTIPRNIFYIDKEVEGVSVEIALSYVDDIVAREISYTNNTITPEGGMHVTGFRTALTRTLNDYGRKSGILKDKEDNLTGDDVREGLVTVISVKLQNPQFEGQTKAKLGSVEARSAVETIFGQGFASFLEEHPEDAKVILAKSLLALKARKAAKAAKDSVLRKGALEGMTLPGKLADCQTKSAEEGELFIVEGDSAGGSSKQGRDRRIQAILPLRGKILNVERARIDKMLASNEIKSLVVAMGASIGEAFNLEKLRYHKVIIATDADVDGSHIRTLLLTFFYRYYRPIIDHGYLFIAQPPLYKIRRGKETSYAYTDEEKKRVLKSFGVDESIPAEVAPTDETEEVASSDEAAETEAVKTKKPAKVNIQRYKGLGEMNPSELWETTMDPARRVLKQVTVKEAEEADHIFSVLMGSEVEPRKIFIQAHAKLANLDI